jgi:predicted esterase
LLAAAALLAAACADEVTTTGATGTTGVGGAPATSSQASTGGAATTASSAQSASASSGTGGGGVCMPDDGGFGGAAIAAASCSLPPPPGAPKPPAPKAYSGGTCPVLAPGDNAFTSTGHARQVKVAVPANLQPNEVLPVIFLWHWLKGSPDDFYTQGEVQTAVDTQRFLAVLPKSKGDLFFEWPFSVADSQARLDEEVAFFDDLLACVSQQFNVNESCVSSVGVSAGALFTDQLAGQRGDYLSSIMSLSGGVDASFIKPWAHPAHRMPAMVLWGGAMDTCVVINFETASKALEAGIAQDCNFVVECIHNCGHTEPPFDAPPGLSKYAGLWRFALDHPYWLPPGASPYATGGLPPGVPAWCAVGAGNAVPRTGMCSGGGC